MEVTPPRTILVALSTSALFAGCLQGGLDLGTDGGPVADAGMRADAFRPPPPPPPPFEDLDGTVAWHMERGGIPGVAAAVVNADGVVWTRTWGYADLDLGVPVAEDTLFIIASISKTVVTVPLMQLVEEGALGLDDPVDDHLPYAVRHPAFPDVPVTVRMLLTHTSGLSDDFLILNEGTSEGDPTVALGAFAEGYVTPDGAFWGEANWGPEPGTVREYCNVNFALVGHLVEVVAGEPLPDRTRTRVFEPLGMVDSSWFLADVDASRLAVGYTWNGIRHTALPRYGFAFYPASSLRTSVLDMGRFLGAHIRGGELDGTRLLSADTVSALGEVQAPEISPSQALTWRWQRINGRDYLSHSGATFEGSALVAHRPVDAVGFIVLTNSDAYVLARLGITDGEVALEAIIDRIEAETELW